MLYCVGCTVLLGFTGCLSGIFSAYYSIDFYELSLCRGGRPKVLCAKHGKYGRM